MAYLAESIQTVRERIAERRTKAETEAENRRAEVEAKSKEIREIDGALAKTAQKLFQTAIAGGDDLSEKIDKLRRENEELIADRKAIFKLLGYPEDYTEPRYTCSLCQDTGYNGTKMCECMKRELILEGFRTSGIGRLIEKQTFDNFSLEYYRHNQDEYEMMKCNLAGAKEFAETVPETYSNLLMMGGTGLGKTHLSTSIARRIIERGYEVRYESVQNIISAFEYDRFKSGRDGNEERGKIYLDAEVLIIDDLGTEMVTTYSTSVLYNLINTRMNRGLPTVINTNLEQKDLRDIYSDRIFSRLFGEYRIMLFRGINVRQQKMM